MNLIETKDQSQFLQFRKHQGDVVKNIFQFIQYFTYFLHSKQFPMTNIDQGYLLRKKQMEKTKRVEFMPTKNMANLNNFTETFHYNHYNH